MDNDLKKCFPSANLYISWFKIMLKHWYIPLAIVLIYFAFTFKAEAKHLHPEKYYQNIWCAAHAGQQEIVLPDGSRADCLTNIYAIEFDFAKKWHESIGQALEYSLQTGKQAGIVLIMENPIEDQKFLSRLMPVAEKYNIKVWTMP